MMKYRTAISILCLSVLSLFAASADAQLTPEQQLSDEFVRAGISMIGYTQVTETDAPQVLAGMLLDAALKLNPDNAEAWSMRIELAQSSSDQEAYESALVGYLATGIRDDRAQFRLIEYRVSKSTTLDEQQRTVQDLLNSPAGRNLEGPVRSRVAGLAAKIAEELLDDKAEQKWAVEAARADPANYAAALHMFELIQKLVEQGKLKRDDVRDGTAVVNIIRANPLMPMPRGILASLLANNGEYERAAQQFMVVGSVLDFNSLSAVQLGTWASSLAMTGKDAEVLQMVENYETWVINNLKAEAAAQGKDPENVAADGVLPPQLMPFDLELVRLSVLDHEDDRAAAAASLARLKVIHDDIVDQAKKDEQTPEQLLAELTAQYTLATAIFGPDLDAAQRVAEALNADDPVRQTALGWLALRRGEYRQGGDLLRPLREIHPAARCGMCLVEGQDNAGRARLLNAFLHAKPSDFMARLAAGRALVNLDEKPTPNSAGKRLAELMSKYPQAFWLVDLHRTPWIEVRLKMKAQRIKPLVPVQAQITVWNTTRFPLAIGEQGPINQQAMALVTSSSSGLPMADSPPIVIDLGRRYTLAAGERMVFDTRLDYHRFGNVRALNPGLPLVFNVRFIVNPTLTRGGNWLPNSVGGVSDVRNCLIQTATAKATDIEQWQKDLASKDSVTRINAIGRLCALDKNVQTELLGPAVVNQVRPAMQELWRNGSEAERGWMIMNARDLSKPSTTFPDLYTQVKQSDSDLIWLALLARQVSASDSPVLKEVMENRQDLPKVFRFAERQRRLLQDYEVFAAEQERLRQEAERLQQPGVLER